MKWNVFVFVLASLGFCSAQTDCFGEGLPRNPNPAAIAKGGDDFSIKLFKDIAMSYPRNSIVMSPYSVWSVLNVAYFGSKGSTKAQLQKALGVPSTSAAYYGGNVVEATLRLNEGTTFNKADLAYFANDMVLRQCAIDKLTSLKNVNFRDSEAAAQEINADVSRATKGKINRFLSPRVIANARFVLINAVYFKGLWTFPFVESRTTTKPFYDEARKANISSAKMMTTEAKLRHTESSTLRASVLELPYEKSEISMFIILPTIPETINSVLSRLTSDVLDEVTRNFKIKQTVVSLPRFKMTTRIADELKAALTTLGITDLFDPVKSDLSNFITDEAAFVNDALHHATIEVTEEGTVASAVTGLIGTRSGASDTVFFIADRPFIFLIRDVSQGLTLFIGVLRNPNHTTPF